MALEGRNIRNKRLADFMPLLWHGLTQEATDLLNNMAAGLIRYNKPMAERIKYRVGNRPYIP